MKQTFDRPKIEGIFISRTQPIWRPISSRELSKLLGVSLQTLANWRVRDDGPEPEPMKKGRGNRIFYRPDKVLAWLNDGQAEPWEYSRKWLLSRDLDVTGGLGEQSTNWYASQMDSLNLP